MDVKREPKMLGCWWPPIFVLIGILLYYLVSLNFYSLPTPLTRLDEPVDRQRFIAERASDITHGLANLGPKIAGSDVNEIGAVTFLKRELDKLIEICGDQFQIEYEVQVASGSFELGTTISVYQGIQNVIAKFSSKNHSSNSTLLINSHFDSVPISDGAGDDNIMVAVMLELLRVLSDAESLADYSCPIVFLFNGAEENGLQGSHAFITQHKWAKNIKAFINLDAAGTGGREMLFQASVNAPWLIEHYKKSVPHPFALITAQEMFDANFIPSDTDFRIFRDYGNIPGVDLALVQNGYVYHTKYDKPSLIPMGTYQRIGDNVLALVKSLVNSEELMSSEKVIMEPIIYYDYLGWFMLSYTMTEAIVINCIMSAVAILLILIFLKFIGDRSGLTYPQILGEFGFIVVVQLISILGAVGIVIVLSIIYDAVNRSMSWYSHPWIVFGIYLCPLAFVLGLGPAVYITIRKRLAKRDEKLLKPRTTTSYQIQMFLHAQCFLFSIFMLIFTALMLKTAFIFTFIVMFYFFAAFINLVFKFLHHDQSWVITIFIAQIMPFMCFASICVTAIEIFVPVQGRGGPQNNPETLISMLCIIVGIMQCSLIVPLFSLCRRPLLILSGFLVAFIVFIIVIATPIGFPYKDEVSAQRFWIFHTERIYHNFDESIRKEESGFFMLGMDRHQNDYIAEFVPELSNAIETKNECHELFCGLPLYTSRMFGLVDNSHWIPSGKPVFDQKAEIQLISQNDITTQKRRYNFEITGSDHMAFYLSPALGTEIVEWSISDKVVKNTYQWNGRNTYYIFYAHGIDKSAYAFYIDIETSETVIPIPALDIVVTAHYIHHDDLQTHEFKSFIDEFPSWSHVTPWMSSYESWQY